MRARSAQAVTVHQVSFASARASAPRLPSDFLACSSTATAAAKKASKTPGSFSRSRVTTMSGIAISLSGELRGPYGRSAAGPEACAPGAYGAWPLSVAGAGADNVDCRWPGLSSVHDRHELAA